MVCSQAISEHEYGVRLQSQIQKNRQAKLQLLDGILFGRTTPALARVPFLRKALVWAAAQVAHGVCLKISDIQVRVSATYCWNDGDFSKAPTSLPDVSDENDGAAPLQLTVGEVNVTLLIKPDLKASRRGFLAIQSIFELHGLNLSIFSGMESFERLLDGLSCICR